MTQVLDYSAGLPGAQHIRDAEYAGAVRYVGYPGRHKCTTTAEIDDFGAHGLLMGFVFEDIIGDWRQGFQGGVDHGTLGRKHMLDMGVPEYVPLYMTIDSDITGGVQMAQVIDYLRGANSVLGGPLCTGVYGEADVLDAVRVAGVASLYWQTTAWSHGRRTTADLYQRVGATMINGVECDINDILTPGWGQYLREVPEVVTDADITRIAQGVWSLALASTDEGSTDTFPAGDALRWADTFAGLAKDNTEKMLAILEGAFAESPPGAPSTLDAYRAVVKALTTSMFRAGHDPALVMDHAARATSEAYQDPTVHPKHY